MLIYRRKTGVALLLSLLLIVQALGLVGCGADNNTRVVFTTGFEKDDVFTIGDVSCKTWEMMVYLTTTQNQYEDVYGEGIFQTSLGDVSLEDNVKETVLAKIAQIKTMYLLALDHGISLEAGEVIAVETAAHEYYTSLTPREIEALDITEDKIRDMYTEYAYACKVYEDTIKDINPEISDDEARTITVQHILLRTFTIDTNGNRVAYSNAVKKAVYEKAEDIRELALDGEHEFSELASKYSEDIRLEYSFGKGVMDQAFETAAFNLDSGAISEVVESESGYHIIKCISTFDREETDANKLTIVEERRNEAFGKVYDAFVETLVRNLNEELWNEISLIHDESVTTSDFFGVIDSHLGK